MASKKAWVTLATDDTYSLGALVLAHSLKKVGTTHDLVVLVTSNVTLAMRGTLKSIFDEVKEVNILDSEDVDNLRLLARPELGITFTKLHCWKLTQYEKCVFLDADTLVLKNCDELFEREELSAAPDVGWPDCFNTGVFVFKPSEETYNAITNFAITHGSYDGADQGLLNMYFSEWSTGDSNKRLPFLYNLTSAAIYSYLPAFKWYGKDVKIIHFISNSKPWLQSFNSVTRTVQTAAESTYLTNFMQYWWDLFCSNVHHHLSPEMGGLAISFSQMKLEEPTPEQIAQEDLHRRENWEQGNIDYLGRDSFDNIWSKISQTIEQQSEPKLDTVASPEPASSPVTGTSSEPLASAPDESAVSDKAPPAQSERQQPGSAGESCAKPPPSSEKKEVTLTSTDTEIAQKSAVSLQTTPEVKASVTDTAKEPSEISCPKKPAEKLTPKSTDEVSAISTPEPSSEQPAPSSITTSESPVSPPSPSTVIPPSPTAVVPPSPTAVVPPSPTAVVPPSPAAIVPPSPAAVVPPSATAVVPPSPATIVPPEQASISTSSASDISEVQSKETAKKPTSEEKGKSEPTEEPKRKQQAPKPAEGKKK